MVSSVAAVSATALGRILMHPQSSYVGYFISICNLTVINCYANIRNNITHLGSTYPTRWIHMSSSSLILHWIGLSPLIATSGKASNAIPKLKSLIYGYPTEALEAAFIRSLESWHISVISIFPTITSRFSRRQFLFFRYSPWNSWFDLQFFFWPISIILFLASWKFDYS